MPLPLPPVMPTTVMAETRASAISSSPKAPWRRIRKGRWDRSRSVDSRPRAQRPPSQYAGDLPGKIAQDRLRNPWGSPRRRGWPRARPGGRGAFPAEPGRPSDPGSAGPRFLPPARTISGTSGAAVCTSVSGPGQKRAARVKAASGTSVHSRAMAAVPGTIRARGFTAGRPFTAYIFSTTAASRPLPHRPYTVSVGTATSSPARRRGTQAAGSFVRRVSIAPAAFSPGPGSPG